MSLIPRFTLSALAIVAALTFLSPAPAPAADTAPATAKAAGPITATLIANKAAYTLDPAQSGQAFRDKLAAIKKSLRPAPASPKVDLTLRLTNTSDKPFTLHLGGDESQISLKLDGPGAVTVDNMLAMTMEFRSGNPVTIEPGKSYDIPITSLTFGARGIAQSAFWTEPGDYLLNAILHATKDDAQAIYTTDAIKIKITKD